MKLRNHWKNILFTALAFLLFLPAAAFPSRADEFPGAYQESRGPGNPGGASPETAKVQEYEAGLGGAELIMYPCADPKLQCLSCLIRTSDGKLIVVDGGLGEDAPRLRDEILSRGGEVTAWLLTHPHGDHAGALYRILEEEDARRQSGIGSEIVIDAVYCSLYGEEWYLENDPNDAEMALSLLRIFSFLPDPEIVVRTHRGDVIEAGSARIEVMNDPYTAAYDKGNNACVAYRVTLGEKTVLFLGDMAYEGGKQLLAEQGSSLKSDIVQMAHHGQSGVGFEVYDAVHPAVALWPTPAWLWNTVESRYTIRTTRDWMLRLGAKSLVTMNGDIVLR